MLTVALAALLAALVAGVAAPPTRAPMAVVRVPDEPDAIVLPDELPTIQALAADLDGDGAPEVVRLVESTNGAIGIEAWIQSGAGAWALMTAPTLAVSSEGGQAERAYAERPIRLILRQVDGEDQVTLVRQPDFTEAADPDDSAGCCLLLDDLAISGNAIELVSVAEPDAVADAVHAIDLDGDETDELLATRSIAPGDDPSTPVEARVFRWADGRFGAPTVTELPLGSPGIPFRLGNTDALPGDEAGFIASSGNFHLFRVGLGPDDALVTEDSGIVASDAIGVPLRGRRVGIAVLNPSLGVGVISWPRGTPPDLPPMATRHVEADASLLGVVEIAGRSHLLVHSPGAESLRVLLLPQLEPLQGPIRPTAAAAALSGALISAYVGSLPGGLPDGRTAAIVAGRLVPSPFYVGPAVPVGALAGAWPVGLVGSDRACLAILHGAIPPIDPAGGLLESPAIESGSGVAIAPLRQLASPEGEGGSYAPQTSGGVRLENGALGVTSDGIVAAVHAPPGSRVYVSRSETDDAIVPTVVEASGDLDVAVRPIGAADDEAAAVTLTVSTPGGHAYVSSWDLQVVAEAPRLGAQTETPIGSTRVTIAGRTAPYAQVEVAGEPVDVAADGRFTAGVDLPPWPTEVVVTAADPFGHETRLVVSGVGLFDYRALPWVPIAIVLLGGIAVTFVTRPRRRSAARAFGDEGALEELDPADRV